MLTIYLLATVTVVAACLSIISIRAFQRVDEDHKAVAAMLYGGGCTLIWGLVGMAWYAACR